MDHISKAFKQLRLKKKMTQNQVAVRLGFTTPQHVSNLERGITDIRFETIIRYAKEMGASKVEAKDIETAYIEDTKQQTTAAIAAFY